MIPLSGVRNLVGEVGEELALQPRGGLDLPAALLLVALCAGEVDREAVQVLVLLPDGGELLFELALVLRAALLLRLERVDHLVDAQTEGAERVLLGEARVEPVGKIAVGDVGEDHQKVGDPVVDLGDGLLRRLLRRGWPRRRNRGSICPSAPMLAWSRSSNALISSRLDGSVSRRTPHELRESAAPSHAARSTPKLDATETHDDRERGGTTRSSLRACLPTSPPHSFRLGQKNIAMGEPEPVAWQQAYSRHHAW